MACFRLGDSSIMPARMMPGKPTPTAVGEASCSTHRSRMVWAMVSAIASMGMLWTPSGGAESSPSSREGG